MQNKVLNVLRVRAVRELPTNMAKALKTFSEAEIAKHKEEEDCWLVIHGKVYDVTPYLDEHPGGPEIMVSNAGAEAGEE